MPRKLFYLSMKFVLCSVLILVAICFSPLAKTYASSGHPYGVTVLAKEWVYVQSNPSNPADTGQDLQNLGVSWVRIQVNESDLENPETTGTADTYNWNNMNLTNIIADAVTHNLQVDFPLQWGDFSTDTDDLDSTCSLPTASAMANYGAAVANHFGSQIAALEIGNEEYSPGRFNWTGSCGDPVTAANAYYQVAKTAQQAIKGASFAGKIGMYGITKYGEQLPKLQAYLTALYGAGIASVIDYGNFHFYTGDGNGPAPGPIASNPTLPQVISAFLNAEGTQKIPIWLTEFGWQTAVTTGNNTCNSLDNVSIQNQANYIADLTQTNTSVEDIMRNDSPTDQTNHTFLYTTGSGNGAPFDCHSIDPANPQPFCPPGSKAPYCDYTAYTQLHSYILAHPTWP